MKKKSRIFDPSYSPYGTYTDGVKGNPDQWRNAFKQRFTDVEIKEIIGEDDPFAILGLKPGASQAEIKGAFRKKSLETHPDRHPEKDGSEFRRVKAAYDKLTPN